MGTQLENQDQFRLSIAKLGLNYSTQRHPRHENDARRGKLIALNKAKPANSSADEIAGVSCVNAPPGSSGPADSKIGWPVGAPAKK